MPKEYLSPAKVNLVLKVLGKRPDGFHDIFSVMAPVSLCDTLLVSVSAHNGADGSSAVTVTTNNPSIPDGPANLAYKAAELILKEAGVNRVVTVHITKRIPAGAGLGGGSSNAAAVLMAINDSLGGPLGDEALRSIAATLGSDVPFFLLKKPALAKGRGEILEPLELGKLFFVLINPGFEVSARFAYDNLLLTKSGENNTLMYSQFPDYAPKDIVKMLVNDLERAVIKAHPEIKALKDRLTGAGALGVLMSGSGPTVFGLFSDEVSANEVAGELSEEFDGRCSVFSVHSLK